MSGRVCSGTLHTCGLRRASAAQSCRRSWQVGGYSWQAILDAGTFSIGRLRSIPGMRLNCRSNLVGMPMAQLLLSMDATVTICHSKSQDVAQHLRGADIVARPEISEICIVISLEP